MRRQNKTLVASGVLIAFAITSFVLFIHQRPVRYQNYWVSVFNKVKTVDDVDRFVPASQRQFVWHRTFDDNTWIVGTLNSVSAGDAFDMALFHDSEGHTYETEHAFSGYEGMDELLTRLPSSSLHEFYAAAQPFELH